MLNGLFNGLKRKSVYIPLLAVIGIAAFFWFRKGAATATVQYVLAPVTRGTVVVSLSGSGQVAGQYQVDIKPKVSGDITKILVKTGDTVTTSTPLFEIDRTQANKTVRDATQAVANSQISLQSAQLSLQKLKQPADPVQVLQAQDALNQAQRDLAKVEEGADPADIQQAQADLNVQIQNSKISDDGVTPKVVRDAYDDAVPVVKGVAQTLQQDLYDADAILGVDNSLQNISYKQFLSLLDSSQLPQAQAAYLNAKQSVITFKKQTDALKTSDESAANVDQAIQNAQASIALVEPMLQKVYDVLMNTPSSASFSQSTLDSLRSNIQTDRSNAEGKLTSLVNEVQALDQARTTYSNSQLSVLKAQTTLSKLQAEPDPRDVAAAKERVAEAQQAYNKIHAGADPIDIQISQNQVSQRQADLVASQQKLSDAEDALNDYSVLAPFDGIIGKITAQSADQASPGTALATILTKAKIAQISLNEVDAAKVKTGQKATLTFDAVQDLSIAGLVAEIDPIGTVSQGVVNYSVKISFDTQDERIKPGMSVSVHIITDVRTDVLTVPNSALKSQGGATTVQIVSEKTGTPGSNGGVTLSRAPEVRMVTTGLANDQMTEITDGVTENEQVVVRTIQPTTTAPAAGAAGAAVRVPGLGGAGGGGGFGGGGFAGRAGGGAAAAGR